MRPALGTCACDQCPLSLLFLNLFLLRHSRNAPRPGCSPDALRAASRLRSEACSGGVLQKRHVFAPRASLPRWRALLCTGCAGEVPWLATPDLESSSKSESAARIQAAGGRHVMLPVFQPDAAAAALAAHRVTALAAVPAALAALAAACAGRQHATSPPDQAGLSVLRILLGAGPPTPGLLEAVAAAFPAATVHFAYGMTEAASSVTFRVLHQPAGADFAAGWTAGPRSQQAAGSLPGICVGLPAPHMEVAILQAQDPANPTADYGSSAPPRCVSSGAEGEVVQVPPLKTCLLESHTEMPEHWPLVQVAIRGPQLFSGYWGLPTNHAIPVSGWFRTGDLGALDSAGTATAFPRTLPRLKPRLKSWLIACLRRRAVASRAFEGHHQKVRKRLYQHKAL